MYDKLALYRDSRFSYIVNVGILLAPSSTSVCPILVKHAKIAGKACPNDPVHL